MNEDLRYLRRLASWGEGITEVDKAFNKLGAVAASHIFERLWEIIFASMRKCKHCGNVAAESPLFCPTCGKEMAMSDVARIAEAAREIYLDENIGVDNTLEDEAFPAYGIYVYYHPYEGYKIGKAENIVRRMAKHECSAPSLQLLHVIETSDLDWCERFLHERFQRRRTYTNHEYFELTCGDLVWLFSRKVLEPPRSEAAQLNLLNLL